MFVVLLLLSCSQTAHVYHIVGIAILSVTCNLSITNTGNVCLCVFQAFGPRLVGSDPSAASAPRALCIFPLGRRAISGRRLPEPPWHRRKRAAQADAQVCATRAARPAPPRPLRPWRTIKGASLPRRGSATHLAIGPRHRHRQRASRDKWLRCSRRSRALPRRAQLGPARRPLVPADLPVLAGIIRCEHAPHAGSRRIGTSARSAGGVALGAARWVWRGPRRRRRMRLRHLPPSPRAAPNPLAPPVSPAATPQVPVGHDPGLGQGNSEASRAAIAAT